MAQHTDLAAADIDTRLYDAARRLAATFSSGLPVYELRPALRQDMSQLCASVLQVDDVALRDALTFESLQAVTLQSVVQAGTGLSLPLDRLLDGANVEELTEVLLCEAAGDPAESSELAGGSLLRVMPDPDQRFEPFPLTDVQQAYLLGRDASYELGNVTSTFYAELETVDLDLDLLEAAFNELIERHDALRTVFRADGYQQVLADVPRYHLVREDVSGLDAAASAERLDQLRAELSDRAFPVDTWPLFELRATRRDDRHTRLHLAFDLLITDGASIARLLAELSQRYEQPGRVWSGLELSFRDYQVAVEGVVGSGRFERARGYWLA